MNLETFGSINKNAKYGIPPLLISNSKHDYIYSQCQESTRTILRNFFILQDQIKVMKSNFKDVIPHFIDNQNAAFANCISADLHN